MHERVAAIVRALMQPLSRSPACSRCLLRGSALERIQPRVVSYEEPVTTIREQLAATLEREEDWAKAAQVLAGIDLDSGAPGWVLQTISPFGTELCASPFALVSRRCSTFCFM